MKCIGYQVVSLIVCMALFSACDNGVVEAVQDDEPPHISRRIDFPVRLDTLRLSEPFRLKANVECHNPIIGLRVEFTDGSESYGDGEVLSRITLPTDGGLEFSVDTLLTIGSLSKPTGDNQYGFMLIEVYEDREYRAGFEPVVILD